MVGSDDSFPYQNMLPFEGILASLVGGFNPFEKYARQIGANCPSDRGEDKTCLKPPTYF